MRTTVLDDLVAGLGDAEEVADEAGDAAGDLEDELAGVGGEEPGGRGGGGKAVVERGRTLTRGSSMSCTRCERC